MQFLHTKPFNSVIEVTNDLNQTTLFWKNPRGKSRFLILVLMFIWISGWVFGFYSVGKQLLIENNNWFLYFWFIGWTIGGLIAMYKFFLLIRPRKPEKIVLNIDYVEFNVGTDPFKGIKIRGFEDNENDDSFPAHSKKNYKMLKNQIGEVRLERVVEKQRLSIDYGAERIEIGHYLTEPEREWLFQVLNDWKGK